MNKDTAWYKGMIKKYGTDEEVSRVMRENSNKSSRNSAGKGGFAQNTPEYVKQMSKKALDKRWEKHRNEKERTET